ncbi:Uncharacterized protein dnm_062640 [Desulfonema magnum]|uniref:Uncharacterized protein n=1 Tax=Desulfonema magnum TaxID=45655 RepID=A0A975BRE5_9BACT|nr:Uncharacterized protein dnm_062640 [Desulfonema magnum]
MGHTRIYSYRSIIKFFFCHSCSLMNTRLSGRIRTPDYRVSEMIKSEAQKIKVAELSMFKCFSAD